MSSRSEVAERPAGRGPQARRDPRRGRRPAGDAGLVVGIGCNLDWPDVPAELAAIATSSQPRGRGRSPTRASCSPRSSGASTYALMEDLDESTRLRYRERLVTLGRDVRVELRRRVVGPRGRRRRRGAPARRARPPARPRVAVGDVVHLRAADALTTSLRVEVPRDQRVNASASRAVSGPGAMGSCVAVDTARSACTSRVVDDRNASSAGRRARRAASVAPRRRSPGRRRARARARASRRAGSPTPRAACAADRRTTTKTFEPVASHSSPRVFGNTASVGAVLARVGERADVLGVRDRLQPGGRAALVAGPGHRDDVARGGPGARARSRRRSRSAGRRRARSRAATRRR